MTDSKPCVDPRATDVRVTEDELSVAFAGGRRVIVPLAGLPPLLHAPAEQRSNRRLPGDGAGIHWPYVGAWSLSMSGRTRGCIRRPARPAAGERQHVGCSTACFPE
jgi:hypothetical protein